MKEIQKAVIRKGSMFLILLRSPKAEFFPEHWDFPGGKLEPNEDSFAGIEREILEETGLKVKALGVVGVYELVLKGISHRFSVYSTKLTSKEQVQLSHEHLDFKWATKDELLKLKVEPYMRKYFSEHP